MKTRRLILAALLILVTCLAGLMISSSRDPIVGAWVKIDTDPPPGYGLGRQLRFSADGTFVCVSDPTALRGRWEPVTGPLYFHRGNGLYQITGRDLPNVLLQTDLQPEHFQQALAQDELNLIRETGRIPLYRVHRPPHSPVYVSLKDGELELYLYRDHASYERPETWLTRGWRNLRDALHL